MVYMCVSMSSNYRLNTRPLVHIYKYNYQLKFHSNLRFEFHEKSIIRCFSLLIIMQKHQMMIIYYYSLKTKFNTVIQYCFNS